MLSGNCPVYEKKEKQKYEPITMTKIPIQFIYDRKLAAQRRSPIPNLDEFHLSCKNTSIQHNISERERGVFVHQFS